MNKELIELLYQVESEGIYDVDAAELEIYIEDRLLTKVTMENNTTDVPEYSFWTTTKDGTLEEETNLTDEEKIFILKEIIAWY